MKPSSSVLASLLLVVSLTLPGASLIHARIAAPPAGPPAAPVPIHAPPPVNRAAILESFGRMPLYFVENRGQMDSQVAYYVQGSDKTIYFTPEGVTFALSAPVEPPNEDVALLEEDWGRTAQRRNLAAEPQPTGRWAVRLEFVGANPGTRPVGEAATGAIISYFKGPQADWQAGLPTYSRIVYRDLWPGVDLVYSGTADRLKYEFIVSPGADPAQIRLAYHGATGVALTPGGQLQVDTPLGGFADDAPVAYQEVGGQRVPVSMAYALEETTPAADQPAAPRAYGFALGEYDPSTPLVLDPAVIVYCGYIGGSGVDRGSGIAVDAAGNVYVTGYTASAQASFPVTAGPDFTYNGGQYDAFVAKVRPDGKALIYAGYIGGSGDDRGNAIAVDGAGNAYIAGDTNSAADTFPVTVGPDLLHNINTDAFVAKVQADGMGLIYAGYVGGSGHEWANGIAVDSEGSAYIAGYTNSTETTFPVAAGPNLVFNGGAFDAFVAKVKPDGSGLAYAGYVGGAGSDLGYGIAVDGEGFAYITGSTESDEATFFVTVGPALAYNKGETDVFVAKVLPDGTGFVYAGYIGGSGGEESYGIAVDTAGCAYVVGNTNSSQATFPVSVGPDLTINGSFDGFVAKVRADGTGLLYAGYIGGSGGDLVTAIAVDTAGNAYVTGYTNSTEATFPVSVGPDLTYNGVPWDAFVAKVTAGGASLEYAGYIGGNGDERGLAIAIDGAGNAYITGWVSADQATFPVSVGPDLNFNAGTYDAFVAKVGLWRTFLPLVLRR
jgi:hypothetical protein